MKRSEFFKLGVLSVGVVAAGKIPLPDAKAIIPANSKPLIINAGKLLVDDMTPLEMLRIRKETGNLIYRAVDHGE